VLTSRFGEVRVRVRVWVRVRVRVRVRVVVRVSSPRVTVIHLLPRSYLG